MSEYRLYKTRAENTDEIFRRFDAGEDPVSLINSNVASANIVYKYRRIWLLLRIQYELSKIIASRNIKGLSLKKLERLHRDLQARQKA